MATVHLLFLCSMIPSLTAGDLPNSSLSDLTPSPSYATNVSIESTSIESTTNLSNHQQQSETSQPLIFWVFVSTSIFMSLVLVLIRGYTMWINDKKPDLSNPSKVPTSDDANGDRMVYGDIEAPTNTNSLVIVHEINEVHAVSSPKSNITDDIEEYVMRELCEIDASYPGFRAPRSSSVGYIEAIYARYSGATEEELAKKQEVDDDNDDDDDTDEGDNNDDDDNDDDYDDEPQSLRIQVNGQDVTCTKYGVTLTPKYGVELTPWSPSGSATANIGPDEFVITDDEEGDYVTEGAIIVGNV